MSFFPFSFIVSTIFNLYLLYMEQKFELMEDDFSLLNNNKTSFYCCFCQ